MFALAAATALSVISPVQDADPTGAAFARQCAASVGPATRDEVSAVAGASQLLYFVLTAAKLSGGDTPPMERIEGEMAKIGEIEVPTAEAATALLPQCDARFPGARSTTVSALPVIEAERDMLCLAVAAITYGAAAEDKGERSRALAGRLQGLIGATGAKVTVREPDASEAEMRARMGEALMASTELGNPYYLATSCLAAYDL